MNEKYSLTTAVLQDTEVTIADIGAWSQRWSSFFRANKGEYPFKLSRKVASSVEPIKLQGRFSVDKNKRFRFDPEVSPREGENRNGQQPMSNGSDYVSKLLRIHIEL